MATHTTTTQPTYDMPCATCGGTGQDPTFLDECAPCSGTGRKRTAVAMPTQPTPEQQAAVADLAAWLATQTWSEFAQDLAATYRRTGRLSERQVASATSMRTKCEAKAAARQAATQAPAQAPTRTTTGTLDLSGLPSGTYAVPGGDTRLKVRIDNVTEGKWAGWVFVKDGAVYGQGRRYGSQRPGATYHGEVEDALRTILADPQEAMAAYGRLTETCGLCGRHLEDKASVARGIGPVCAAKAGW